MMNDRWGFDQDSVTFDKLIDGELSREDERGLLSSLEEQPDGWRRCALAFLEARALRDEMTSITRQPAERVNGTPVVISEAEDGRASPSGVPRAESKERWRGLLTLATSLLIAFCLGIVVRGQWMQQVGALAVQGEQGEAGAASKSNETTTDAHDDWQLATLTMNVLGTDGEKQSKIELPLIEAEAFDARLLRSKPTAVPERVREALVQSGHTLEEERLLVPVYLQDGRRAIVAVDRAQVSTGFIY